MASVSSLDHDMRKLRLDRYTPAAANEVRRWIEEALGESLAPGDLMDALRDGVALCKLVNRVISPGVRFKASNMPFVQMENISHFLRACEMPPLNLPSHDRFLTVDLYDSKDPAQVIQCLAAFSRRANIINSTAFPSTIGGKGKTGSLTPETTGQSQNSYTPKVVSYTANSPRNDTSPATTFNSLNRSTYANTGGTSPTKSNSLSKGGLATGGPVSSWSKKDDESKTAPAWNIHQYGYLGGASQGNQGISFGARRQITSQAPEVPSLAEKEKRRKEDERLVEERRIQEDIARHEAEEQSRLQFEAEEVAAQMEEQRRIEEETRRFQREEEEEEERAAKHEQERESPHASGNTASNRGSNQSGSRQRTPSDARLNGQFLSAYHASQKQPPPPPRNIEKQPSAEARRIADLERQLAEMKAAATSTVRDTNANDRAPIVSTKPTAHEDDWDASERDYLRKQHQTYNNMRDTEEKQSLTRQARMKATESTRPLPDPTSYQSDTTRTSRFLATNPAPEPEQATTHIPSEFAHGTTAEVDAENARREASQRNTRAGGWASKSLLEREMERERDRQREWEENQKQTATAARDTTEGSRPGQSWNVNQYGYMGGDSQNRVGPGLGMGGPRRQIIGPRPPP